MSDIKTIEILFNKYANSKASYCLISKVFINCIAIRLIENYISENQLGGMSDTKKFTGTSSELIRTQKIEIYVGITYKVFTLNNLFSFRGYQYKTSSIDKCIYKTKIILENILGFKDRKKILARKVGYT